MKKPPSVFISYSHDSESHIAAVLEFSNALRAKGIDAILDQYEEAPPEGWPRWMDKHVRSADYVILVCTEKYWKRVMGEEKPGEGLGIRWEGNLIYQHLYNSGSLNTRFIPVLRNADSKELIPTPLQGSTFYRIDKNDELLSLIRRIHGVPKVPKPSLGEFSEEALPEKKVRTDVKLFLTGFIDISLWDKARWRGTCFITNKVTPPYLGLIFEDEENARKIFLQWRERFGKEDVFEEMRIAIVEGPMEGEPNGYSAHITANIDNILKRADEQGIDVPRDMFMIISRLQRMDSGPGSPHLQMFKTEYSKFRRYHLIPVIRRADQIKPIFDIPLLKKELVLRNVADVKEENDLDAVLIKKFRERMKSRFPKE